MCSFWTPHLGLCVQHLEAMRTVLADALSEVGQHQAQAAAALQELHASRAQVAVLTRELRASQDLVRMRPCAGPVAASALPADLHGMLLCCPLNI